MKEPDIRFVDLPDDFFEQVERDPESYRIPDFYPLEEYDDSSTQN